MSLLSNQIEELRGYADSRKGHISQLTKSAADTIEELSEKVHQLNMERGIAAFHNGWIPLDTMEPVIEGDYLVCDAEAYIDLVTFDGKDFVGRKRAELTAWMPLPAPYKE